MRNSAIKNLRSRAKSSQSGVVLLEALIAILLFSMGVLALVGLQGTMMKNTEDSKLRSEASYLAQKRLGLMWANPDPANLAANFAESGVPITSLPNGSRTVNIVTSASGVSTVTVRLDWQQPGKDPHHYITVANIAGS